MTRPLLKQTLFMSLLGHITFFSIFSLSFGRVIPKADYISVSFWGQFLLHSQINHPLPAGSGEYKNELFFRRTDTSALDKIARTYSWPGDYYLKPQSTLAFNGTKEIFLEKTTPASFPLKRREPMIIFHPLLPYGFTLYFKDRQIAHVELMFNIVSSGTRNSIALKRKISSGNLEVDLLSMRYISHYLFIQQARFAPNNWQTVKIDLSAKND